MFIQSVKAISKISLSIVLGIIALIYYHDLRLLLLLKLNFNWVFSDITSRIVVVLFLTCGLFNLTQLVWKKGNKLFVAVASLILAFGASFYNPIYVDDYGVVKRENLSLDLNLLETHFPNLIKSNKTVVLSFFTSTCPYCAMTAQNFIVNQNINKQPKTIVLFPSVKEDAEKFMKDNDSNFDYALISDKEFTDNAGHRFPSVFLIQNGKVTHNWIGSEINYSVLDFLRNLSN